MKKVFKIAGITLAVFVLVANVYSAVFTFYGVKTNNLAGAVWAQSTSSSSSSSGAGIWTSVGASCALTEQIPLVVSTSTSGSAGVSLSGITGSGIPTGLSITGASSNSTSGVYAAVVTYNASRSTCGGGNNWTCVSVACYRPTGVKPDVLLYNGQVIPITSTSH